MPSLADSYQTMVDALARQFGQTEPLGEERSPFERVLAIGLARVSNISRPDATLGALDQAGLLDPEELAGANPAEIVDAVREAGITLPARGAPGGPKALGLVRGIPRRSGA